MLIRNNLLQTDLAWVLSRYDIDLTASQFKGLMTGLKCPNEGDKVTWDQFHQFFKEQEAEEDEDDNLRLVKGLSVKQAVALIREKIDGVVQGGPDGLRRAFRIFDADASGGISYEEFDK